MARPSRGSLSAELLAVAIATCAVVWRLKRGAPVARTGDDEQGVPPGASLRFRRRSARGAQALLAGGAITLAIEADSGLYWWPAAVTAAYVSALTNASVLLIEILR
jgi:hypothetical protein